MSLVVVYVAPNRTLDQAHFPGTKQVPSHTVSSNFSLAVGACLCVFCVGPLCGPPLRWWVLCGALPSVWLPCVGPLCGSPVWVPKSANPWRRERKRSRAMSRAVLSSSSQRSMKQPSGKHIHKTRTTAGIPRGEGMTPATPPLGPTEPQHKSR